jgi:DNA-directed RNA polymerase subunit K/omega
MPRRPRHLLHSTRAVYSDGWCGMEAETIEETSASAVEPVLTVPPVNNRFLFVDIAAQRAKQLRRGARSRLDSVPADPARPGHRSEVPHKAERVAMEEVRRGLVQYKIHGTEHESPEAER